MNTDSRREYLREYQRLWKQRRREQWIQEHSPCHGCGSWDELEIDHKDSSSKLVRGTDIWSLSPANPKRIQELEKCQVLCRACHIAKTTKAGERFRAQGELHGNSKLTTDQVLRIRELCSLGLRQQEVAKIFDISRVQVHRIQVRQAWVHV